MMQNTLKLILLLAAVAIVSAAPKNSDGDTGKLQILSLTQQELRAVYHTGIDEGIELLSEITDQFHYISITTLDGTQLVSAKSSSATGAVMWKIMGYTLLLHSSNGDSQSKSGVTEYAVPLAFTSRLEKEMQRNQISSKLLSILDPDSITETKRSAFSELLSRPEIDSIIRMSQALGAAGVMGYENPAALNFHALALHYAKMQKHPRASQPALSPRPKREEGGTLTCTKPGWFGSVDIETNCIRCPIGEDCTGMCGPECSCWSYVCGDCCYHQGCFDHDMCCTGGWTYFNYSCAFPFPFDCANYKYKCIPPTDTTK